MRKMRSSRSISSASASRSASRKVITRGSDIDVLLDRVGRRHGRLLREVDSILALGPDLLVDRLQVLLGGDAEARHALAEHLQRIALHPFLHLFPRPVLGGVGDGVAAEAV